jgi:hypothetical protein
MIDSRSLPTPQRQLVERNEDGYLLVTVEAVWRQTEPPRWIITGA